MFDEPTKLVLGLLTGILFGFLLQKGQAAKFNVIIGQFLLKDWTVVKIMGTAVIVGVVGVYALVAVDLASLHVKPLLWGGVLIGAICFGIGIAVFGYCPGTSVAACGEGRRDAMVGVLGMRVGAAVYVALFPVLQPLVKSLGDAGKITIPQVTGTSPWPWVVGLAIVERHAAFATVLQAHEEGQQRRPGHHRAGTSRHEALEGERCLRASL